MMFSRRFNVSFFILLGFGTALLASLVFFIISVFPDVSLFFRNLGGQGVSCNCSPLLSFVTHPFFHSLLLISFFASCALLFTFSFFTVEYIFKSLKLRHLLNAHKQRTPPPLFSLLQRHHLEKTVLFIQSPRPSLFCFGFFRPSVVISEGVLKLLTQAEMEAAILHEKRHLLVRDPLRLMLTDVFFKTFFWLPGMSQLHRFLRQSCEFAADEFSLTQHHSPKLLARALVKCLDTTLYEGVSVALSDHIESRLAYLLERMSPSRHLTARFVSLLIVLVFAFLSVFLSQGYAVLAAFSSNEDSSTPQCELLRSQKGFFSPALPMSVEREFMSKKPLDVCQ